MSESEIKEVMKSKGLDENLINFYIKYFNDINCTDDIDEISNIDCL